MVEWWDYLNIIEKDWIFKILKQVQDDTSIMNNFVAAIIFILLSILFRTIWHLGPNIEFITTATLLARFYLGKKWTFVVPFASIVVSDIFIGNSSIYLFTWTAYFIISLFAILTSRKSNCLLSTVLYGFGSGLWFYTWTNFGVWLIGGLYPLTLNGLLQSYTMGLPFLRLTLVGTVGLSVLSVGVIELFRWLKTPMLQWIYGSKKMENY